MPDDSLLVQTHEGVTTLVLNRAEHGNRVSDPLAALLAEEIHRASTESQAIVLRANGSDFCLGREVFGHHGELPEAYDLRNAVAPIFDLYDAFRASEIPTIALVQGRATGFGCALAAVADITIAANNARFSFPEISHHIMPTMAMSSLADRVPLKALMYLIYSAEEVDAAQALQFGLASKIVESKNLDTALDRLLDNLKGAPLPAVKAVKEYALAVQSMDTSRANNYAKNLHATVNSSSKMLSDPDK